MRVCCRLDWPFTFKLRAAQPLLLSALKTTCNLRAARFLDHRCRRALQPSGCRAPGLHGFLQSSLQRNSEPSGCRAPAAFGLQGFVDHMYAGGIAQEKHFLACKSVSCWSCLWCEAVAVLHHTSQAMSLVIGGTPSSTQGLVCHRPSLGNRL